MRRSALPVLPCANHVGQDFSPALRRACLPRSRFVFHRKVRERTRGRALQVNRRFLTQHARIAHPFTLPSKRRKPQVAASWLICETRALHRRVEAPSAVNAGGVRRRSSASHAPECARRPRPPTRRAENVVSNVDADEQPRVEHDRRRGEARGDPRSSFLHARALPGERLS